MRESGLRADALLATEPLETTPARPQSSGTGLTRPAINAREPTLPRVRTATPIGAPPVPMKAPPEASPPRAVPTPMSAAIGSTERYFFATSDDFVPDRAQSIVALGRGASVSAWLGASPAPERGGPTSAVRDVLSPPFESTPRPAPSMRSAPRERGEGTGKIATQRGDATPTDELARRTAEAQVKGAMVAGALEHIEAAHGPRAASLVLVRLDASLRARLEGVILPMAWLPLAVLEQLVRVTDEVAGRGDGTTAEAIGRACADRELPTTHRMFMQSATPRAAIERVPQLHRAYFSRGDARLLSAGPNAARLSFDGTGLESPMLTLWTGGFVARLVELSGARDVRVMPGRGEKGDEKGTFAIRWR